MAKRPKAKRSPAAARAEVSILKQKVAICQQALSAMVMRAGGSVRIPNSEMLALRDGAIRVDKTRGGLEVEVRLPAIMRAPKLIGPDGRTLVQ
jgi:hypothetical protein